MASLISRRLLQNSTRSFLYRLTTRGFADDASGQGLALTFGTPYKVYYNAVGVRQVDVSSTTGSFGILPSHVPTIAALKPGVITVYEGEKTEKFFVSSGTITVNGDSTAQILAEEAATLDQLDIQTVRQGLDEANAKLSSASSEYDKAAAQVQIDVHEAMIKALE